MSSIANITVKKNDGTTDVVYTAYEGKSGDNPARWKAPALGATPNTAPEVRCSSRQIPKSEKSKVVMTFVYPYSVVNSTTGVTTVENRELGRMEFNGDMSIPQGVRDEAASQFCNLVGSATFKTILKELGAPV